MCFNGKMPMINYHVKLNNELIDMSVKLLKLQMELFKMKKIDESQFIKETRLKISFLKRSLKDITSLKRREEIEELLITYEAVLWDNEAFGARNEKKE